MTRLILGIDPGTTESGICLIEAKDFNRPNIVRADKIGNSDVKELIWQERKRKNDSANEQIIVSSTRKTSVAGRRQY